MTYVPLSEGCGPHGLAHPASHSVRHPPCPSTPSRRLPEHHSQCKLSLQGGKEEGFGESDLFWEGGWGGGGLWGEDVYVLSKVTRDVSTLSYFFACDGSSRGVWTNNTRKKGKRKEKEKKREKKYIYTVKQNRQKEKKTHRQCGNS